MSRPSLFQIFQLAHGPSLSYTMGAYKAGQYFRTQLIGFTHHEDNRILVELYGDFSHKGKDLNSDMALVAALGGFNPNETDLGLRDFFNEIKKVGSFVLQSKIWPFTIDSDLIFRQVDPSIINRKLIKFHLLSPDQIILLQAEYEVFNSGLVTGPGSREADMSGTLGEIDSFSTIVDICNNENLTLRDYILSYEKQVHSIESAKTMARMKHIWNIMKTSIDNGLNQSQAQNMHDILSDKLLHNTILGFEPSLANIYALAVCKENLDNQTVIAAPVCETSGILPAVLKTIQQKYHFSDDKMADSLLVAGFIGTLLQQLFQKTSNHPINSTHFPIATAMASAGGLFLLSSDLDTLKEAVKIAVSLSDFLNLPGSPDIINLNIKHSNLAIEAINLSLSAYHLSDEALEASILTSSTKASTSSSEL